MPSLYISESGSISFLIAVLTVSAEIFEGTFSILTQFQSREISFNHSQPHRAGPPFSMICKSKRHCLLYSTDTDVTPFGTIFSPVYVFNNTSVFLNFKFLKVFFIFRMWDNKASIKLNYKSFPCNLKCHPGEWFITPVYMIQAETSHSTLASCFTTAFITYTFLFSFIYLILPSSLFLFSQHTACIYPFYYVFSNGVA